MKRTIGLFLLTMLFVIPSLMSAILQEGFEGTVFPPLGWEDSQHVATRIVSALYANQGNAVARITLPAGQSARFILPKVLVWSDSVLSFYAKCSTTNLPIWVQVETSIDKEVWTPTGSEMHPYGTYYRYQRQLPRLGQPIYVALKFRNAGTYQATLYLDDISAPDLYIPTVISNPLGCNIIKTESGLLLRWLPVEGATGYHIYQSTGTGSNAVWREFATVNNEVSILLPFIQNRQFYRVTAIK